MQTLNADLSITQGSSFSYQYTGLSGVAFPLTGHSLRSNIRFNYSNCGFYNFNIDIINTGSGIFNLYFSPSETSSLQVGKYFYDVEAYTSGDSDVQKLMAGKVFVYGESTYTGGSPLNLATGTQNYITQALADTLYYPLNSNPSGYLTGFDSGNYASLSFVTGISGDIQNQINIINNNPSGYLTGFDSGNYATINLLLNTSGDLVNQIAAANTGVQSLNGLSSNINISSSTNNIGIIVSGQTIFISGIYSIDKVSISSGNSSYFIPFSRIYSISPKVNANLELTGENVDIVPFSIFNITTTGYYLRFADILTDDYFIQSFASI